MMFFFSAVLFVLGFASGVLWAHAGEIRRLKRYTAVLWAHAGEIRRLKRYTAIFILLFASPALAWSQNLEVLDYSGKVTASFAFGTCEGSTITDAQFHGDLTGHKIRTDQLHIGGIQVVPNQITATIDAKTASRIAALEHATDIQKRELGDRLDAMEKERRASADFWLLVRTGIFALIGIWAASLFLSGTRKRQARRLTSHGLCAACGKPGVSGGRWIDGVGAICAACARDSLRTK